MKTIRWLTEQNFETQQNIIEFPAESFSVSIDAPKKRLVFVAVAGKPAPKIRTYALLLKQKFNIQRVNSLDDQENERDPKDDHLRNSFEIIVDPRENFEAVIQYLRSEAGQPEPVNPEIVPPAPAPIPPPPVENISEACATEIEKDLSFFDALKKKKNAIELVKRMRPLDIANVLIVQLDIRPKDASRETISLIKHAHRVGYEGLMGGSIETNKSFPVPSFLKRDVPRLFDPEEDETLTKDIEDVEENALARPQGKVDITPKYDFPRHHFPPEPRAEPMGFPYDDMTVAALKPGTKGRKRPLMMAKKNEDQRFYINQSGRKRGDVTERSFRAHTKKGRPFDQDLDLGQPGGDGAGGGGIYSKRFHSRTGDMPGGGSTWTSKGTKGWNSMPGKEFDDPTDVSTYRNRAKVKKNEVVNMSVPPATNVGKEKVIDPFDPEFAKEEIKKYVFKTEEMMKKIKSQDAAELPGNELEFMKSPNAGASLPVNLGVGGKSPPSNSPYRGSKRR